MINEKDWNCYFMQIAKAVATNSKDPSSMVGCVIVDANRRVVSTGYNGFLAGCDEDKMTYERPMKYHLILHAEMNALIFAKQDLTDCTVYCTHAPCENCLKYLLQAGIKRFIYIDPTPITIRGSEDQKLAIIRLLESVKGIKCESIIGEKYINQIKRDLK